MLLGVLIYAAGASTLALALAAWALLRLHGYVVKSPSMSADE